MSIGGYTLGELTEEVLSFQFSEAKYKPFVRRWLNQGQRRAVIESEIRIQESAQSIATVSEDPSYALPSDFSRLIDLFYVESHELVVPMDVREFDALPASTGRPYAYTVRGAEVVFYPTPDAAYNFTLRYWRLPQDMVNDADTPEIPVQYHELLVAYAMRKAFLREDDFQAAQQWEAVWEKGLLKMRGEVQHSTFDGPRQVGGTWNNEHGLPPIAVWR